MDLLEEEKRLRKRLRELEEKAFEIHKERQKLRAKIATLERQRLEEEKEAFLKAHPQQAKLPTRKEPPTTRLEREFVSALGLRKEDLNAILRSSQEHGDSF